MAIPSRTAVELPLLCEIERAGGKVKPTLELLDNVAKHFGLTPADKEARGRSGGLKWKGRVRAARGLLIPKGELDGSTRGIWRITDKGRERLQKEQDKAMAEEVKSAEKATEIARSFIKKYRVIALPIKTTREDDVWNVELDVGPLAVKVAKVKVDAKTGSIISYEIPQMPPI